MNNIEFKYVPLSFISSDNAIEEQLINTLIFKVVLEEYNTVSQLSNLIHSTQYGYTASAKSDGKNKLLRITDIKQGKVNWNNVPLCNCDREEKYLLSIGDILIARTGNNISYLVEKNVPKNAIFASYLIRIICNNTKLLPEYLFLFLNSYAFWPQILSKQRGATLQNVNAKLMGQLNIPTCPIEKQKEIINNVKSKLTDKIKKEVSTVINLYKNKTSISTELTHQLDLVKKLRQSFLREAMQGKLTAEWRTQHPDVEPAKELLAKIKAEKEQLIKDPPAGRAGKKIRKPKPFPPITKEDLPAGKAGIPFEIPESWVWTRLGEIVKEQDYGTSSKASLNGEVPVLRMGNITSNGKIKYYNLKYVSTKIKDLPRLYLEINDLVFNRTNSYELVGKCGVFNNTEKYTLASYLIRVRFTKNTSSKFISNYINSSLCRDTQIEPQIIQQNGQANFNGTKLSNIYIPLPPLSEQKAIVKKLDELMAYCDSLEESIKNSQSQNEMLLQQVLREALEPKKMTTNE